MSAPSPLAGLFSATAVGTLFLYVFLSPGMVLSLPPGTYKQCKELVPSPTSGVTNDCDDASPDAALADICHARKKCTSSWTSRYTNIGAVFLHGILFVALLGVILSYLQPLTKTMGLKLMF